jgi:nucleotide-binding universal stress UspA family protein
MSLLQEQVSVFVETILLATDFSPASEKATAYAKALARRFSSTVEIAHVFDPSVVSSYEEAILSLPIAERRQASNEHLNELKRIFAGSGITTDTVETEGHRPAAELLKIAKQFKVDLIVSGTRSKSGMERLLLGSTAEEILRSAICPVLTVGPKTGEPADGPLMFKSILFATDFSAQAAKAAVFALSFAQDSGAHLYFCHVVGSERAAGNSGSIVDGAFEAALMRMIPECSYDWCSPECVVEHGDAAQAVLAVAGRVHADLIVLGARKASFLLTHLERGVTPDLLAEATCPVMTVC